jgi:hypothetical protein
MFGKYPQIQCVDCISAIVRMRAIVWRKRHTAKGIRGKPSKDRLRKLSASQVCARAKPSTGVIDFGALTMIGDADLDLACAVLSLTGVAGVTPADRRVALKG